MAKFLWPVMSAILLRGLVGTRFLYNFVFSGYRRKTPWEIKLDRDKKIALREERKKVRCEQEETEVLLLSDRQVHYLREAPMVKLGFKVQRARCDAMERDNDYLNARTLELLREHR